MSTSGYLLDPLVAKMEWAAETLGVEREITEKELKRWKLWEYTNDRIFFPRDDGSYEPLRVTVALHYCPYLSEVHKGGENFSNDGTPDACRASAFSMTHKNALVRVEFGGGKTYMVAEHPITSYSHYERHAAVKAGNEALIRDGIIRTDRYLPATDAGTNSEDMDEGTHLYLLIKGTVTPTPFTGRSVGKGGVPWREQATAHGGIVVFERLRQIIPSSIADKAPEDISIIVQGLGQVGGNFIRLINGQFAKYGIEAPRYRLIGIANVHGGVYNPDGIDVSALSADPNAPLPYGLGETCSSEEILLKPCDVLVPAAKGNVITRINAHQLQAKWVLPLANFPIHPSAEPLLDARGILFPHYFHANAGGVFVSFEEYRESHGGPIHDVMTDEVRKRIIRDLTQTMENATEEVMEYSRRYNASLSDAAWLASVDEVVRNLKEKHKFTRLRKFN